MKTNDIIIKNLQHWLNENGKSQKSLADEMNISELLVEHILSGKRSLLPEHIEVLSELMDTPIKNIARDASHSGDLTVEVRGQLTNRRSKQDLDAMLFAVEDYIKLNNNSEA